MCKLSVELQRLSSSIYQRPLDKGGIVEDEYQKGGRVHGEGGTTTTPGFSRSKIVGRAHVCGDLLAGGEEVYHNTARNKMILSTELYDMISPSSPPLHTLFLPSPSQVMSPSNSQRHTSLSTLSSTRYSMPVYLNHHPYLGLHTVFTYLTPRMFNDVDPCGFLNLCPAAGACRDI